ncbi:class I SAM-dependent methyltransferase [Methanofollis fontis]|uniref:SAM-dependent methyltransferase n=1 Tax=Methanofollis fontis TaxID=2052832 RepID=A0A483CUQ7_9EURY|nr:class I SAM-dependent methyltransferase [Methanofollis fontis]TAJ45356.1 SAM-dependent methyltransferase [Methanofollis fontis]
MKQDTRSEQEKAEGMDRIARTIFAPIYPVLAEYFFEHFGRRDGVCIDLGSGPGHLAIAVATASEMEVWSLDISASAQAIAENNIQEAGLEGRVRTVPGNVAALPFPDASADLVVSRGSVFFWEDLPAALREAARVLKNGGMAIIGGGFGNAELNGRIVPEMIRRNPDWGEFNRKNISSETMERFREALSGVEGVEGDVVRDESGLWIVMRKGASA